MKIFPELADLLKLEKTYPNEARFETLTEVNGYPIKAIVIGSEDKQSPTFGLFGGVHGLEKVGSQIIVTFLQSLFYQMSWDNGLREAFKSCRIVTIPIINPGGMAELKRSNLNGVDLMRNAPVEADRGHLIPLISGHNISSSLPWYRGDPLHMEMESKVLINFVKKEMFPSEFSIALDVHSGFGVSDQIWYPYAKTKEDFPFRPECLKLKKLLDLTFPHHIYKFESQSVNYLTHGDLWDYLFDEHERSDNHRNIFLPLTLELGSWRWIKKNPLQFFSKLGIFHPIKKHRHSRIMRRHIFLLDFLIRASKNHKTWVNTINF